jgi:hypothetical protein
MRTYWWAICYTPKNLYLNNNHQLSGNIDKAHLYAYKKDALGYIEDLKKYNTAREFTESLSVKKVNIVNGKRVVE